MNGKYDYYRIYLKEEERLQLKLNWNNRLFFVYLDKHNHLILSRNVIPKSFNYFTIKADMHHACWTIDIPRHLIQNVDKTYYRYALQPITPDKLTCQLVQVSPRIILKEKKDARITPLSKSRREQIEKLQVRRNSKSAKNRENPDLIDTLQ